jgi:predicted phosphodiesterase
MLNLSKTNNSYEKNLYKKYGKANKFKNNITILFISDTHNALYGKEKEFSIIAKEYYDICILLGDHSNSDIEIILKYVPLEKVYGILGNHDSFTLYENFNIRNLHNMKIEINGVKITGFQGSFKYTDKDKPFFSHEESVEILNNLEYADIFVTHDKPFLNDNNDPPHDGLKGITNYIYKNKIPFHVHGHLHNNDIKELKNKTISCCVYPFKIIDFNEKGINV